ncbi:MAG TPA: hypothetical protein ENJ70_02775 [Thermoplasmatales archaeon]|nr:hypothetical protein [Thermoplasmatales archaeon]
MKALGIVMIVFMLTLANIPAEPVKEEQPSINICVINGFFVYRGEDGGRVYFKAIYARMAFMTEDKGMGSTHLINSSIAFSKPFHSVSISLDNYIYIFIAFASNWKFVNAS